MESLDSLYVTLYAKASELSQRTFHGLSPCMQDEIAHDVTVDFLIFSRSFRETYDPELGSLKPFFVSYFNRKARGTWERTTRQKKRTLPLLESTGCSRTLITQDEMEWLGVMEDYITQLNFFVCEGIYLGELLRFMHTLLNLEFDAVQGFIIDIFRFSGEGWGMCQRRVRKASHLLKYIFKEVREKVL